MTCADAAAAGAYVRWALQCAQQVSAMLRMGLLVLQLLHELRLVLHAIGPGSLAS